MTTMIDFLAACDRVAGSDDMDPISHIMAAYQLGRAVYAAFPPGHPGYLGAWTWSERLGLELDSAESEFFTHGFLAPRVGGA